MRTIKIILSSILLLVVLNLAGQSIESPSESTKSFFIGGNINAAYSEDFGPQGNVGTLNTTFGTFDINAPSTTSTATFVFNPYVGIIKTDKVSIGISALFDLGRDVFGDGRTSGTFTNPQPFTETRIAYGLGVFYRRDLLTKERFTLFAQFASQYTRRLLRSLPENQSPILIRTNDIIDLSAELGGKFAINPHWNLIASIASANFNTELDINKEFDFRSYHNSIQFGSILSNFRFGIERSFGRRHKE